MAPALPSHGARNRDVPIRRGPRGLPADRALRL